MHPERRPKPDRSRESLKAKLRALPPPPIPGDLEARLLAAIPARMRRRHYWGVGLGLVGAAAAACLIVVLMWPRRDQTGALPMPPQTASVPRTAPQTPDDATARLAAWRVRGGEQVAAFAWPLEETSPMRATATIPPELLN